MTSAALTQRWPVERAIPEDPSEPDLVALYGQPDRTVRLGLIRTPRGALVGPDGSSRSLSGPADLRVLRTLRAVADVVLVGATTARQERYTPILVGDALRVHRRTAGMADQPTLVVVTRSLALPEALAPGQVIAAVPVGTEIPHPWLDHTVEFDSANDLVRSLHRWGQGRVLCEGGATLAHYLGAASALDEWCVTTALGAPEPGAGSPHLEALPPDVSLAHRLEATGMIMERWVRSREPQVSA